MHSRVARPFSRYLHLSVHSFQYILHGVSSFLHSRGSKSPLSPALLTLPLSRDITSPLILFGLKQVKFPYPLSLTVPLDHAPTKSNRAHTNGVPVQQGARACFYHSLLKWNGVSPSLKGTSHAGPPSTRPLHTPASQPMLAQENNPPPPRAAEHDALQSRNSSITTWRE